MFLTTRGRYAVSAIIDIVTNSNLTGKTHAPTSLSQISQRQGISISYLEQIFLLLKKHNIVKSVKGPGGGYILAKTPNEITLSEILFASGEKVKMTKFGH
jgi:Rrf2 family iron-sulfur cluster assembly transcriptional regulator